MKKKPRPFQSLKDSKPTSSVLIFGPPGSGKTYSLRTVADSEELLPAVIVSCDGGHKSVESACDDEQLILTQANSLEEIASITQWCIDNKHSLIIDGLTELYRKCFDAQVRPKNKKYEDISFTDYGVLRNQFLYMISKLCSAPINLVVIVLAHYVESDRGINQWLPNLPGKLSHEVPSFFNAVLFADVQTPTKMQLRKEPDAKTVRRFLADPSGNVLCARNQGGYLSAVENINLPTIFNKLNK